MPVSKLLGSNAGRDGVVFRFAMTGEQIQVVSEIGKKTAADRIAEAACDIILRGSEGAAVVTLQSGPQRGKLAELSADSFETLYNLTADIVAQVRRAFEDRGEIPAHEIRNMVFAMVVR